MMQTLEAGDTQPIDLYGNKGAADPGLIAAILEAADDDANKLLSDSWILVTNDQAGALQGGRVRRRSDHAHRARETNRRLSLMRSSFVERKQCDVEKRKIRKGVEENPIQHPKLLPWFRAS